MSTFKRLAFLWAFSLPLVVFVSSFLIGGYWVFAGAIYSYLIIPILDLIVGKDADNVIGSEVEELADDKYFSSLIYLLVYAQFALLVGGAWLITSGTLNVIQIIGYTLSVGVLTAGGINLAHELGHKSSKMAQWHSKFALMQVCYMHFFIEHNKGHHVHVATPLDPATSKKNQTIYQFLIQTIFGSYKSAWNIEKRRLERQNSSVWTWKNDMIKFAVLPILLCIALTLGFSLWQGTFLWLIPIYFFVQSYLAFSQLEVVNYIEHYGIERQEIAPGRYERVNPLHSWNANHFISNLVLFQLQRHSDHHAHAARPYQVLRHFDESPQLPFGYPVMILMAFIPPLWFKIMNHRLENWKALAYDAEHIKQIVKATA